MLFRRLYTLNAGRSAPGIGRFASDGYFGGNPWYPLTLGFAELHYRLAANAGDPERVRQGRGLDGAWYSRSHRKATICRSSSTARPGNRSPAWP